VLYGVGDHLAVKRKQPIQVMFLFGTRPEAIKLAPVITRLRQQPELFQTTVVVTAQHREMLDQVLEVMHITPDIDLNLMQPQQSLAGLTADVLRGCERILDRFQPDLVLVQGDTATTLAATLASFYQRVPVGHIEAGLRTYDHANPFPEEVNRQIVSVMAEWHFAATVLARQNLLAEGIPRTRIFITGNPVVDALYSVLETDFDFLQYGLSFDPYQQRNVVVTAHRRENFGKPLIEICRALKTLARRFSTVAFVFPIHRNPLVRKTVKTLLKDAPENLHCLSPLPYKPFINLLAQAELVLTDSGGIQEEAPALGVPALVLRKVTERPEALTVGARLIPLGRDAIIQTVSRRLERGFKQCKRKVCPFGDGRAAERIARAIAWMFGQQKQRPGNFKA